MHETKLVKNSLKIREIVQGDYQEVIDLIHKTVKISNSPDYPQKIIDHQINVHYTLEWLQTKSQGKYIVVATLTEKTSERENIKSRIVGVCALKENTMTTLFVDPDFQHLGIGKVLVEIIERKCRDNGNNEINLESSYTARNFYLKLGYKVAKEEGTEWLGERVIAIQMNKVL